MSSKQTSSVTYNLGLQPNEAVINYPLESGDDDHLDSSWFFQQAKRKIGEFCEIYLDDSSLFRGYTYDIVYDKNTGMAALCKDVRWPSSGVRVLGGWIYSDYLGEYYEEGLGQELKHGSLSFDLAFTPVFNPGGMPNCIVPESGIPCFAPHPNFNLKINNDGTIKETQQSAVYWTLDRIITYLTYFYGYDAKEFYTPYEATIDVLPKELTIPEGFGSSISSFSSTNFDQGREQGNNNIGVARKGREVKANGMGVLELIEKMLDTAGGQTLFVDHAGGGSDLKIVPKWYKSQGLELEVACSGDMPEGAVFHLGTFEENGQNLLTACHLTGQSEFVERRISTTDPESENALLPAWSPDDQEAFLTKCVEGGNFSRINFDDAVALYPAVFAMWKIDESFDYRGETGISYPLVKAPRYIKKSQLSFRGEGEGHLIDYSAAAYPIYVEISNEDGSAWGSGIELKGFQILDTGSIYLPGLRDSRRIWFWKTGYSPSSPGDRAEIDYYDIRMNVAIQGDNRLQVTANELKGLPDSARVAENFVRTENVYSRVYRKSIISDNSFPLGEASGGTPADSGDLFDDTALAEGHLTRKMYERGRLEKGGTLVCRGMCLPILPGTPVEKLVDPNSGQEIQVHGVIGTVKISQIGEYSTEVSFI